MDANPPIESETPNHPAGATARRSAVVWQIVVLSVLTALTFRRQLVVSCQNAVTMVEWAHIPAVPVLIGLLLYVWRGRLAALRRRGSWWGMALIGIGLLIHLVSWYPLRFGLGQAFGMVPVIAGLIVTLVGWAWLRACLPLFLLLILAFPLGERTYDRFTLGIQERSLRAVRWALSQLPDVEVTLEANNLPYTYGDRRGWIGLGECRFGVRLLTAGAVLWLVVLLATPRPAGHIVVMLLVAPPVLLLGNVLRLGLWGAVTIYGGFDPVSGVPACLASAGTLVFFYVAFVGADVLLAVVGEILAGPGEPDENGGATMIPAAAGSGVDS